MNLLRTLFIDFCVLYTCLLLVVRVYGYLRKKTFKPDSLEERNVGPKREIETAEENAELHDFPDQEPPTQPSPDIAEVPVKDELQLARTEYGSFEPGMQGSREIAEQMQNLTSMLQESEKRLTIILENIREGVIASDLEGRVTYMNPVAEWLTGWSLQDALGRLVSDVFCAVNEQTLQPLENPVDKAVRLNQIVTRSNEALLVGKHRLETPIDDSASPVRDPGGRVTGAVLAFRDMTERRRYEEQIRQYAFQDSLTGLPNRRMFNDRLKHALAGAEAQSRSMAVLFIDLDHFKLVNDSLGHEVGDILLKEVALRLTACVRPGDLVARLGGDEFIVLLEDCKREELPEFSESIRYKLSKPYYLDGKELFGSPSIGISLYPDDGDSPDVLINNADIAMYHVKMNGKNGIRFYEESMKERVSRKLEMDKGLRKALELSQFRLVFQPKVHLDSGQIIGVEALARWDHPELGEIPPDEFIPVAEETGLIVPIGKWVLEAACYQLAQWLRAGVRPLRLAVNVSVKQLAHPGWTDTVREVLRRTQLDPARLELEITESVMRNGEDTIAVLHQLKQLGIYISIDDFGTGYSSLNYLKRLPVDALKIDKSFVREMFTDQTDADIVTTIIGLAKNLQLSVIAEGVETPEQAEFLRHRQCAEAQGYLWSKPLPADRFLSVLTALT